MLKQKGNFGKEINLGSATGEQADTMGKAWVGPKYRVTSDVGLESLDGLRKYRPPSWKEKLGKAQANFERRFEGQASKEWQANGHIDIINP
jgi:filamentous hemagglutinin